MFWDIALPVLAALAQGLTGFLGWRVTVDGVKEERKKLYEWLFAIASLVGVVSVGIAAYRGSQISRDLADLKQGQQSTNAGIQTIANNPPTVVVNPPAVTVNPPQQLAASLLRFEKLESALSEAVNGLPTGRRLAFVPGATVQLNLYWLNDGAVTADRAKGMAAVYLAPNETKETEKELTTKFKQILKRATPGVGTIPNGGHTEFWYTAESDRVVTQDDIDKLAKGTEVLYLFDSLSWIDPTGSHYIHRCIALQHPAFDPEVWHFCHDFSDHR
jgi:hypothetical protein